MYHWLPNKIYILGRKIGDIDEFYSEQITSRILNRGDIIRLGEKAMEVEMPTNTSTNRDFDLVSLETHLKQLKKIGGLKGVLKYIPGAGKIQDKMAKLI